MKMLLRLAQQAVIVSSIGMLGCNQNQRSDSSPASPPAAALSSAQSPEPIDRPTVQIIEFVPARVGSEEQEIGALVAPTDASPPVVVRASDDEAGPYGHAPDYRWLTGELRYSPARGAWCLHYAPREEQDAHGGSVTLVGTEGLADLRADRTVRVEGGLIDPQSREPSPAYHVRTLRLLPDG